MKTKFSLLLICAMCVTNAFAALIWNGASAPWTQGTGKSNDPYLIENPKQLAYLSEMVNGGVSVYKGVYFRQTEDFDMNSKALNPIGFNEDYSFQGIYDGNNKSISNLYFGSDYGKYYVALFGYAQNAIIKNIVIKGTIKVKAIEIGCFSSILAYAVSTSVENCDNYSALNLGSVKFCGGIVAYCTYCNIESCSNYGNIGVWMSTTPEDECNVGGIVGYCYGKSNETGHNKIYRCKNEGSIRGSASNAYSSSNICYVGGISGYIYNIHRDTIEQCYNVGSIMAKSDNYANAGGILGGFSTHSSSSSSYFLIIKHCFARDSVVASGGTSAAHSGFTTYGIGPCNKVLNSYYCGNSYKLTYGITDHTATNCYFCTKNSDASGEGTYKSLSLMKSASMPALLNVNTADTVWIMDTYGINAGLPILEWMKPVVYTINCSCDTELGSVTGGGEYIDGKTAVIQAIPKAHCYFEKWSDGNTDATRNVVVSKDSVFVAIFKAEQYEITTSGTNGEVLGSGKFNYGVNDTLIPIPTFGYHFTQWGDGNTENPRIFVVTKDSSFTAMFDLNTYIVKAEGQNGVVSGGDTYMHGSSATLTATANEHYHFVDWSDGNTNNPRAIVVTSDTTLTANFAVDQFTITAKSVNASMGSVTGSGSYDYNSSATLQATSNYGYTFIKWSDGNTSNPRTIQVTKNAQYVALFNPIQFSLLVISADDMQGEVSGSGDYNYNSTATITATPNSGYKFEKWDDENTENPRQITITDDLILIATWIIDETTGINTPTTTSNGVIKYIKDGKIYILRDGKTYNALGIEVND